MRNIKAQLAVYVDEMVARDEGAAVPSGAELEKVTNGRERAGDKAAVRSADKALRSSPPARRPPGAPNAKVRSATRPIRIPSRTKR